MTPLLGTESPSAPVGDAPAGDGRAARSLLSCALWRGMGRLWRGMGGMVRPEPLSAHHPRQQQGLSGFHESRDTKHGFFVSLFTIVHHCSRLFIVQQKNIVPAPVSVPAALAVAAAAPCAGNAAFGFFTRHESRITAFYRVLRPSSGEKCRLGVGPGDQLELAEGPDCYVLRPRRIDLSLLGGLRDKIPTGHPPFDISKFREKGYDPALRD